MWKRAELSFGWRPSTIKSPPESLTSDGGSLRKSDPARSAMSLWAASIASSSVAYADITHT